MKLSVIVPYYNTNALIGRALDSLLDQDLEPADYEIIVVDDGSTEEPVVLKEYAARCPQIKYCRIEHAGLSPARNNGLDVAQGDWLYFCDSDDYLQRQVLGGIIAAAEERGLDMIDARCIKLKPDEPVPEPKRNFSRVTEVVSGLDYLGNPPSRFTWGMWQCLFRHSFINVRGFHFENIFYVEDCLFKLEAFKCAQRVAFIDVDLYYYILNDKSVLHYKRMRDGEAFAAATLRSIDAKTAVIVDPATPPEAARQLMNMRLDDTLGLMTNVFRYCSVKETGNYIASLESRGLYPLPRSGSKSRATHLARGLVNRKHLWLFLCRIFHLLPFKLRVRF